MRTFNWEPPFNPVAFTKEDLLNGEWLPIRENSEP
jgi:hypothetical protein